MNTRRLKPIEHRDDSKAGIDLSGLEGQVGYLLRRAQLAVFDDFSVALKALNLRPGQFAVLNLIGRNAGITQNEVCAVLGIQRANLVTVLDELERRGVAERRPSATDRRANTLHLTIAGVRLLTRALDAQAAHEGAIESRLGKAERDRLLKILRHLTGD